MKLRNGFVSNSSSSSFIVNDLTFLTKNNINYIKLTPIQIELIAVDIPEILTFGSDLWLSQYVSDGGDEHWQLGCNDIEVDGESIEYMEGNHGYPYGAEDYDKLEPAVKLHPYDGYCYILKKHNIEVKNEN